MNKYMLSYIYSTDTVNNLANATAAFGCCGANRPDGEHRVCVLPESCRPVAGRRAAGSGISSSRVPGA